LQRGYYHYDVQDYARLINAKPRKKDGSFDKSEYDNAINQAVAIRKNQLGITERKELPYLADFFTKTVSKKEYEILKPYLVFLKNLTTIIFYYV
jgi:hypothetical protein